MRKAGHLVTSGGSRLAVLHTRRRSATSPQPAGAEGSPPGCRAAGPCAGHAPAASGGRAAGHRAGGRGTCSPGWRATGHAPGEGGRGRGQHWGLLIPEQAGRACGARGAALTARTGLLSTRSVACRSRCPQPVPGAGVAPGLLEPGSSPPACLCLQPRCNNMDQIYLPTANNQTLGKVRKTLISTTECISLCILSSAVSTGPILPPGPESVSLLRSPVNACPRPHRQHLPRGPGRLMEGA